MNRFLKISGIVLWVEILCLSVIGLIYFVKYTTSVGEVEEFHTRFEVEILGDKKFEYQDAFFTKEYIEQSGGAPLELAFEKFGDYESCDATEVEVWFNRDVASVSAESKVDCQYSNWPVKLELVYVKTESGWRVHFMRMISEAFKNGL